MYKRQYQEKQHVYLLPPDMRWEGSFEYLFALVTNYFNAQTNKIARVEPGSPDRELRAVRGTEDASINQAA